MLHVSTNVEFIEGDVYYVQRNERSCALVSERNQIYIQGRCYNVSTNYVQRNVSNVGGNFNTLLKGLTTALKIALLKDSPPCLRRLFPPLTPRRCFSLAVSLTSLARGISIGYVCLLRIGIRINRTHYLLDLLMLCGCVETLFHQSASPEKKRESRRRKQDNSTSSSTKTERPKIPQCSSSNTKERDNVSETGGDIYDDSTRF